MKASSSVKKGNNDNEKVKNNIFNILKNAPITFIENKGQLDSRVKYYSKKSGCEIYFTKNGLKLKVMKKKSQHEDKYDKNKNDKVKLDKWKNNKLPIKNNKKLDNKFSVVTIGQEFINVNKDVVIEGIDELQGKFNYFKGKDSSKWVTGAISFEKITYKEIWKGIDLIFYCKDGKLKYDFIVKSTGNIEDIQFIYNGPYEKNIDTNGNIIVKTPLGDLINEKPVCYQEIKGKKLQINGEFSIIQEEDSMYYGYKMKDKYDSNYNLIIDPGIVYSTFLGGSSHDIGRSIAVDKSGNAYVTGATWSYDFPTTEGAFQETLGGYCDAFVSKLNSSGTALVYSTYLGGSGHDYGYSIAVDESGNAYVTGYTKSSDFPITEGAFQEDKKGGQDVFITKLNPLGTVLEYSTFLGGSGDGYEKGEGISVDESGNAYVTGATNAIDFPTTEGAFQETLGGYYDVFVSKLNPLGNALVYSTYLGGSNYDHGLGIVIDEKDNAYVTGETWSYDFPITEGVFQESLRGICNVFITKIDSLGESLVYSTYIGGNDYDHGNGITIDKMGNVYITGDSNSHDFPITKGAFQENFIGTRNAFVSKLNPLGTDLVYSTYLGGNNNDAGDSIAVDESGNAYVTGYTNSTDFPTKNAFQESLHGESNVFVSKLNPLGKSLIYSSYLGGSNDYYYNSDYNYRPSIAVDESENAYVTGYTVSSDFPTTKGAYQENKSGYANAFITKISRNAYLISKFAKLTAEIFD